MDADWILIHKIRNGDEAAIDSFVRKYYSPILKYCFYRTSDSIQAEDLAQETFYRFFKTFSAYKHKGKLAKMFIGIATRVIVLRDLMSQDSLLSILLSIRYYSAIHQRLKQTYAVPKKLLRERDKIENSA